MVDLTGESDTIAGSSSASTTPKTNTTVKADTMTKDSTPETLTKGRQTKRSRQAGTIVDEEAYSTCKEMAHMKPWHL